MPFQYLIELHYSQTAVKADVPESLFQYLIELHYSQTSNKLRHYNAQGNNIRYFYYTTYVMPSSITQRSSSTIYTFSPSRGALGAVFSTIKRFICSSDKSFNSDDISSGEK